MYRLSALPYILPVLSAIMLFVTVKTKSKALLCIVAVISSLIILLSVSAVTDSFFGIKQTETEVVFDESNSSNHASHSRKYFFTRKPMVSLRDMKGEKYYVIGDIDRNPTSQFVKTDVRITYLPNTRLIIAVDEIVTKQSFEDYLLASNTKEKSYLNIYHMDSELGWLCILIVLFIIVFSLEYSHKSQKRDYK